MKDEESGEVLRTKHVIATV